MAVRIAFGIKDEHVGKTAACCCCIAVLGPFVMRLQCPYLVAYWVRKLSLEGSSLLC
jgi:hypothetical protein